MRCFTAKEFSIQILCNIPYLFNKKPLRNPKCIFKKYLDNGDIYEEAVLNEDAYRDFNNG